LPGASEGASFGFQVLTLSTDSSEKIIADIKEYLGH